jgi:uroporphyrin-III C-methyltransferase/precorrin-2 dehydrogenase/sirohydrochlorin ferrochelatase
MSPHLPPRATRPGRLAPLAKLPVFFDLAGKRAVVAGGGEAAAWKAELLAAAGADVVVFTRHPCPELLALAGSPLGAGSLVIERSPWSGSDLRGAAIAVGDIEDPGEADRFAREARRRGVPVNVIDTPALCDFQFGAIVNRSPVVVALSTDGGAPILAQALRRRIEAILPGDLGAWGEAARSFRDRLAALLPSKGDRRTFWEGFVDLVFSGRRDKNRRDALEILAERVRNTGRSGPEQGEVALVGAGPGDPELLTLKAVRALQAADVIVHDRLVSEGVLELGRREARRILVGKEGHGASCRQDDINALVVQLALEGQRVVRLKGGDPGVFGRAGEEVAACRAAGVPVRIVPGVTTALAAAASLKVSLTHRDHAQRVQFVTGHGRAGGLSPDLDLDALADPHATTCIYMGRQTAPDLARLLMERGLGPDTPAIVVTEVSSASERAVRTTIAKLADGAGLPGNSAPTMLLIGAALDAAETRTAAQALSEASLVAAPAAL